MHWVKLSAIFAAYVFGRVDIAPELLRICRRESRCLPIKVHDRDAHLSRASWRGQIRLRHLDPSCQPQHVCEEKTLECRLPWATRGPWGLNAAAHWQYMPPCYHPEWFDYFSAFVAARKWLRWCDGKKQKAWC